MIPLLLAAAALSTADARFQSWVNAVAAEEHQRVVAWGPADLDDGRGEQRIALLHGVESDEDESCSDGRHTVLVEDGRRRWRRSRCGREGAEQTGLPRCAGVASVAEGKVPWAGFPCKTLEFASTYLGSHGWNTDWVAIREGRWVITRRRGAEMDGHSSEDNFDALTSQFDPDDALMGDPQPIRPIVLVSPPGTKVPRREPLAIAGASRWSGPRDADVQFQVTESKGDWRIHVSTRDDVLRTVAPGADDRAFVGSDHVEVWFVSQSEREAHQLGIASRSDRSLDVRWLFPVGSTRPLPRVSGRIGRLDVEVPAWTIPTPGSQGWAQVISLAVAYSDADGETPHQDSLVGPHSYAWGKPETFEFPWHFPNAARYPEYSEFKVER